MFITLWFALVAQAHSQYSCQVSFGETVPIRKVVLKSGSQCAECAVGLTPIPEESIESQEIWNRDCATDPALDTKLKRHAFYADGQWIFLETRYAKQMGPKFDFSLDCANYRCSGSFLGTNPLVLETATLYDQRIGGNKGTLSILLGNREHLGFIARITKHKVPYPNGLVLPVSASGELKFFSEDAEFILDLGADEQFSLSPNTTTRIAALEAKIDCKKNQN